MKTATSMKSGANRTIKPMNGRQRKLPAFRFEGRATYIRLCTVRLLAFAFVSISLENHWGRNMHHNLIGALGNLKPAAIFPN